MVPLLLEDPQAHDQLLWVNVVIDDLRRTVGTC